ncbi:hypothetical protein ACA910_012679 [Epithemia clementina (nom. ined.)]
MDLNPRALECTYWNFVLNGFFSSSTSSSSSSTLLQSNHPHDPNTCRQDRPPLVVLHLIQGNVCQPQAPCRLQSIIIGAQEDDKALFQTHQHEVWKDFTNLAAVLDFIAAAAGGGGGDAAAAGQPNQEFQLTALLANPPFVPAPPLPLLQSQDEAKLEEGGGGAGSYGLFSTYRDSDSTTKHNQNNTMSDTISPVTRGSNGEEVLRGILEHIVRPYLIDGRAAIVSEFFWSNQPTERLEQMVAQLFHREQQQDHHHDVQLLLVTNEYPLNMRTYAQRRTFRNNHNDDDDDEFQTWYEFLTKTLGYKFMSPGFLFLDRTNTSVSKNHVVDSQTSTGLWHGTVHKSKYGSLWTPSNPVAKTTTENYLKDYLKW